MANTQTTVPKFTTLEVLSSEDQNLTAGTGCPVFANATTRNAAFGGPGEKVLAEGQICYLESTNVVQLYDGAAWQTVGPAPAASSGLVFISSGSIGTGASFSLPNNSFTATYLNYQLMFNNVQIATGGNNVMLRMRASGTDITSSNYYNGMAQSDTSGNVYGVGQAGTSNWRLSAASATQLQAFNGIVHFYQPQTNSKTFFTSLNWGNNGLSYAGGGGLDVASQQDSATIIFANGANFGAGTYTLYGLADS
jgi:hypothetical protein